MDERTLRVLEFHKIKERLAAAATNNLGRELALALAPVTDPDEVSARQRETTEARAILASYPSVPLGGISDIRPAVARARVGSTLTPQDLLDVAWTMDASSRLRKFIFGLGEGFETMRGHAARITPQPALVREITRCLDEQGDVVDHASPVLARLRADIRATSSRIRDKLDSLIRSPEASRYLQDPVVTLRGGRFVVPVKQEHRAAVPGIVHDQSSSGLTLFVEPMAVVELNNELASLEAKEREEVERILRYLSGLVRVAHAEIQETVEALGALDFAFAKGRLSLDMDAVEPELNTSGYLEIRRGRHPLLSGHVVPIDVELGGRFRTLVVTGPNTGGKTVSLKTIGLFALMTLAGLHLPAASGTRFAVFQQVFADIGDEQSIEQSLSTFSSHMTHIVKILKEAGPGSLVLLDELGAGTDPAEGASLGIAILEHLHLRGARTVATTHYSELKTFAYEREGVENASCEFDVATLRPTYRLIVGVPGSSCAFEVAARLGLPREIVDSARARLGEDRVRVEHMIAEMERSRRELEEDRERARSERQMMEKLVRERDEEARRLREARSEILRKARDEAARIVSRARQDVARIIEELKQGAVDRSAVDDAARRAREALKRVAEETFDVEAEAREEAPAPRTRILRPGEIAVGASVYVPKLGSSGRVVSIPRDGEDVEVQVGAMKLFVSPKDLAIIDEEPGKAGPPAGGVFIAPVAREKAAAVSSELDLRGLTVEEALAEVDKYLDDACLAGLPRARIIHGKGTGALRQAVRDFVRSHPHVRGFEPGGPAEGGDGVTVVAIRGN
ncbi:MAG: endonuclease MutS2 [Firmicutes bacterium]|nr:endonuclease MutS2 [Bacillota bacterium]